MMIVIVNSVFLFCAIIDLPKHIRKHVLATVWITGFKWF